MDFTTECAVPGLLGEPLERAAALFSGVREISSEYGRTVHGTLTLGGVDRLVAASTTGDRTSYLNVDVTAGDTFCGVPLANTPIRVQRLLHDRGIETTLDDQELVVVGHPVGMYIFENEVNGVSWSLPDEEVAE
ncbi:hypothetical protein [Corynebacterium variabile]|uniref:hypothetical protein n=1 Tax=Corynebacterium variabile TaxID=1727 RepID=UPI0028B06267|nr:hypothetical protein [Corynebacterium variabile]